MARSCLDSSSAVCLVGASAALQIPLKLNANPDRNCELCGVFSAVSAVFGKLLIFQHSQTQRCSPRYYVPTRGDPLVGAPPWMKYDDGADRQADINIPTITWKESMV